MSGPLKRQALTQNRASVIYGGVVKSRVDIARNAKSRGNTYSSRFCSALDRLQDEGFCTELWVDLKNQTITLRWTKKGAKWHIRARGNKMLNANLEQMGMNALSWCRARERGTGVEQNYAVRES